MASGQVLNKLRNIYSQTEAEVKSWNEAQAESLSLLGTIRNIISRLPILEDPSNYGPLTSVPEIKQKLVQKQILGLDKYLGELSATLAKLEAACRSMERHARNAQWLVQQEKRLTATARATVVGPIPSIDQCIQGLQDIWKMHADELQLKRAILSELQYDTPEADLQHITALYAAQPNIDAERVRDLLYIVGATAEAQQFR